MTHTVCVIIFCTGYCLSLQTHTPQRCSVAASTGLPCLLGLANRSHGERLEGKAGGVFIPGSISARWWWLHSFPKASVLQDSHSYSSDEDPLPVAPPDPEVVMASPLMLALGARELHSFFLVAINPSHAFNDTSFLLFVH